MNLIINKLDNGNIYIRIQPHTYWVKMDSLESQPRGRSRKRIQRARPLERVPGSPKRSRAVSPRVLPRAPSPNTPGPSRLRRSPRKALSRSQSPTNPIDPSTSGSRRVQARRRSWSAPTKDKLVYLNVNGLAHTNEEPKLNKLKRLLCKHPHEFMPRVLAITESHLTSTQDDNSISLHEYKVYRQDHKASDYTSETHKSGRPKPIGQGGVCVYIHEGLTTECRDLWKKSFANVDTLIVHLTDISIAIVIIYRPPESTPEAFRQALDHIDTVLENIDAAKNIFLGDFNLETAYNPTPKMKHLKSNRRLLTPLSKLTEKFTLTQQVTQSTHKGGNTLDLIFKTNNVNFLTFLRTEPTYFTDHYIVFADVKFTL